MVLKAISQGTLSDPTGSPTQVEVKPSRVFIMALRTASLGVAYGLWALSRWLYVAEPVAPPLGVYLLAVSGVVCAFFIFLGTVALERTVARVWKAIGKALLYVMLFT